MGLNLYSGNLRTVNPPPISNPQNLSAANLQNLGFGISKMVQNSNPILQPPIGKPFQMQNFSNYHQQPKQTEQEREINNIVSNILALMNPETRYDALDELNKKREAINDLAPILWWSVGTIAILFHLFYLDCKK